MSEQWEYRKAQILWLCDLPRKVLLAIFFPLQLALFGLVPALLAWPFNRERAYEFWVFG